MIHMTYGRLRRLAAVPVAMLLAACVSAQSWEATRVLQDIDAGGAPTALKERTPAPTRTTISYRIGERTRIADLYEPNQPIGAGLVLVPGFTRDGKDDERLVNLALSLSRARFLVLVPEVRGTRELRVRLGDARTIADAAVYLAALEQMRAQHKVGVVAISYAVGLAVLATLEPDAQSKIEFVVGLGGYYDTAHVVTFITTGRYREPGSGAWKTAEPHPAAKWIFLASNVDALADARDRRALLAISKRRIRNEDAGVDDLLTGLSPGGRALYELLANTDPARVDALTRDLPVAVQRHMERLSLANYDLSHLAGRLILIHGRADNLIPSTESRALAGAVPGTELFLIDGFSHIDPSSAGLTARLQLIDAIQALLERRRKEPAG